jgi:hypothetical protein
LEIILSKQYYTYIYLDPQKPGKYKYPGLKIIFPFEPFYVGRGQGGRWYQHILEAEKDQGNNKKKLERILEIINKYSEKILREHIIKYTENMSKSTSIKEEIMLIENIGRMNMGTGPLTNIMLKGWVGSPEENILRGQRSAATRKRRGTAKIAGQKGAATMRRRGTNNGAFPNGKDHPNAKKLLFISPNGKEFIVQGGQVAFLIEYNLSEGLRKYKDKGKFPKYCRSTSQKSKNTVGWECRGII